MIKNKIIVIGGNAAGPAAAAKAKRINPDGEVILFEKGEYISTGTCELPYVLSGHIENYKDIIFFSPDTFYKKKGVKVFCRHNVEKINRKNKNITVRDLETDKALEFSYDSLVLATGSVAKKLPALPFNLENVSNLKTVGDLLKVKNFLEMNSAENVLIIGSGYIGLETADAFKRLNKKVTIVEMSELPLPSADTEIQELIKHLLDKNNVEFISSKNVEFKIVEKRVESVSIDGIVKKYDFIISCIGLKPNSILAEDCGLLLDSNGAVKVNNKQQTSDHNIYSAGDNSLCINFITKRPDYFPLATLAHQFGHIAGANAAGANLRSAPVIRNIAVKLFGHTYGQVGLTEKETDQNRFNYETAAGVGNNLVPVMPESKKVFGKIIYYKDTLNILGASFFGGNEVCGYGDLIVSFMKNKLPAVKLYELNYNYTPPLSPFVNLLSILGRKIGA